MDVSATAQTRKCGTFFWCKTSKRGGGGNTFFAPQCANKFPINVGATRARGLLQTQLKKRVQVLETVAEIHAIKKTQKGKNASGFSSA